jgi:hypothetical protein
LPLPPGEHELSRAQVALLEDIASKESAYVAMAASSTGDDKQSAHALRPLIDQAMVNFTKLKFKNDSDEAAAFAKAMEEATTDEERKRLDDDAKRVIKEKTEQERVLLRYAQAHGVAKAYKDMGMPLVSDDPIAQAIYQRLSTPSSVFSGASGYGKPAALARAGTQLAGFRAYEVS